MNTMMEIKSKSMDAGDLVICRIIRNQSGSPTESHWMREVLATDVIGNPTHVCLVGNPLCEIATAENTLEHQSTVVVRGLDDSEKKALEIIPDSEFVKRPLDAKAGTRTGLTNLEVLGVFAEIFGESD